MPRATPARASAKANRHFTRTSTDEHLGKRCRYQHILALPGVGKFRDAFYVCVTTANSSRAKLQHSDKTEVRQIMPSRPNPHVPAPATRADHSIHALPQRWSLVRATDLTRYRTPAQRSDIASPKFGLYSQSNVSVHPLAAGRKPQIELTTSIVIAISSYRGYFVRLSGQIAHYREKVRTYRRLGFEGGWTA